LISVPQLKCHSLKIKKRAWVCPKEFLDSSFYGS
jgi:hypothetical protein